MAHKRTFWQDHVTEFEDRYTERENEDGTITHIPVEGEVIQQGTAQNAPNFNNMEEGIFAANELGAEAVRVLVHHGQAIEQLSGEKGTVTLTNTQVYPFNNSRTTVALVKPRQTLDYTVSVEAVAVGGGAVGEIVITDKQLNGFKIEHTGSAAKVSVKYIVEGGMV